MCIDYNGGYIEDRGLDFVLVFFLREATAGPYRNGTVRLVRFFFFFFTLKQVTVQVEKRQISFCSLKIKALEVPTVQRGEVLYYWKLLSD